MSIYVYLSIFLCCRKGVKLNFVEIGYLFNIKDYYIIFIFFVIRNVKYIEFKVFYV